LLASLEEAVSLALITEIERYIEEIRCYNATIADVLATFAFDFEYKKIVSLIQEAKSF